MVCKNCGGDMTGDGYSEVRHCENLDLIGEGYEPDANPVYCTDSQLEGETTIALSQQAAPSCSDERPCVPCFSDDGACLAEPANEEPWK